MIFKSSRSELILLLELLFSEYLVNVNRPLLYVFVNTVLAVRAEKSKYVNFSIFIYLVAFFF